MKVEKGLIVFFALLLTLGAGFTYGSIKEANAKKELADIWTAPQVTMELIATSDKGDVKHYRLVDNGAPWEFGGKPTICYITVGELHGKTVATECK